ncbi:MAG: helix-turn-helix domain-containing protein [Ignavibacteriaceae bacterium]|jgi:AraC-like DNA-binding protein
MFLQDNIIHIFGGFAIIQSIIILIFLGNNKLEKNKGNYYLRAIIAIFIIQIINNILFRTDMDIRYYKFLWISNQLVFLIAPLVYFYILSLLDNKFSHKIEDIVHLLPFILSTIYVIIISLTAVRLGKHPGVIILGICCLVQNIYYIVIIHRLLQKYGLNFKTFFTYVEDLRLSWARYIMIIYIAFWFIYFYIFFLGNMLHLIDWCPYYVSLFSLSTFIILNGIVYIALKKLDIFKNPQKYQKSTLKGTVKNESLKKLEKIMEQEKLYLDPSLNLIMLAKKISIAPCHLSRIINESFNKSFNSFVNYYRVKESTKYLIQNSREKMNILEIAYTSGFNSKSSFNNAFKKHMGLTPTEYRYKQSG